MRRIVPLKTLTLTSGGRFTVDLDQLPGKHYLKSLLFTVPLTMLQNAAPAIVLPRTFNRIIDSLKCGRRIALSGQAMDVLAWLMTGKDQSATAYIAAGAGTFDRVVNVPLHFSDPTAYEPDDTAAAVELFRDTPLEVGFGSLATLFPSFTGVGSVTPGPFQTLAVIEAGAPGKVATPVQLDEVNLTPDTRIDPGVYTHLGIFKDDGTAITSAEVAGLTVIIDGVPVIDNANLPQLAALFNMLKSDGAAAPSTTITTPFLTVGGENVNDQPGGAAAAGAVVSAEFLPVLFPSHAGKLTKAWACPTGIRIKYTGSATGLKCVTRRVEPVSDASVVKAAAKMGLRAPTTITSKTASKAGVQPGSLAELVLPKRVG
ncbi:MAG: hypothetical protein IPO09_19005 [Anaeromyxobacter sp.]|nr:hypothetical protein [Anaeromyxobacter sp.]MBL0276013.1 hypothetical protein [Anaeromyxobacter sp.]